MSARCESGPCSSLTTNPNHQTAGSAIFGALPYPLPYYPILPYPTLPSLTLPYPTGSPEIGLATAGRGWLVEAMLGTFKAVVVVVVVVVYSSI